MLFIGLLRKLGHLTELKRRNRTTTEINGQLNKKTFSSVTRRQLRGEGRTTLNFSQFRIILSASHQLPQLFFLPPHTVCCPTFEYVAALFANRRDSQCAKSKLGHVARLSRQIQSEFNTDCLSVAPNE